MIRAVTPLSSLGSDSRSLFRRRRMGQNYWSHLLPQTSRRDQSNEIGLLPGFVRNLVVYAPESYCTLSACGAQRRLRVSRTHPAAQDRRNDCTMVQEYDSLKHVLAHMQRPRKPPPAKHIPTTPSIANPALPHPNVSGQVSRVSPPAPRAACISFVKETPDVVI